MCPVWNFDLVTAGTLSNLQELKKAWERYERSHNPDVFKMEKELVRKDLSEELKVQATASYVCTSRPSALFLFLGGGDFHLRSVHTVPLFELVRVCVFVCGVDCRSRVGTQLWHLLSCRAPMGNVRSHVS